MAVPLGTRFGPYEIQSAIGAGGMGEVYRATDTNLKRAVAIKVLLDTLASDDERILRFRREAEVLASLNHPNIAALYGLENADGVMALVMELVEGADLAERLAPGAMPIDETLPIAAQIAEALAAARRDGTEFFYTMTDRTGTVMTMMAVSVSAATGLPIGPAHELFNGRYRPAGFLQNYDVTANGQRFLMVQTLDPRPEPPTELVLVQNWLEELKARVPTK